MPATLLLAQQDDVVDAFACAHGALELPGDIMSLRKPGFLAFAGAYLQAWATTL